jgi:hypothetical protein
VADEVVYSQAGVFKTMHEPPDPLFNVDASFADSIGISFSFTQASNNWQYVHVEFFSSGSLIGSKFLKFAQVSTGSTSGYVTFEEQIPWKRATSSGGGGGYPGSGDPVVPSEETGDAEYANEGNMLCLPFGSRISSCLPTCGIQLTTIGSAGVAFTAVAYSTRKTTGISSAAISWGDGSSDSVTLGTAINHTWASVGIYTVTCIVNHADGSTDSANTYVTVE